MRIFLDVGAHDGETLDVALDPKWGFDRIDSFEPASTRLKTLRKFRHKRLAIHDFGLSSQTKNTTLYGAGLLGGSIYSEKNYLDPKATSYKEEIKLQSASEWLTKNTSAGDEVFLKLNCEGSEADILENLIAEQLIFRVKSIYVDFDIRKVPGQAHRQKEIEDKLRSLQIDFQTPDTLGTAANAGVEKWLAGSLIRVKPGVFKKLYFSVGLYRPFYLTAKKIVLKYFPRSMKVFIVHKFGRHSN
jgi:FkbM family methyltransferase